MKRDDTEQNRGSHQSASLFLLFVVLFFMGCTTPSLRYNYISNKDALGLNNMVAEFDGYRVIFVGEGHTSVRDHIVQLEVIQRLKKGGKKVAIALEMFPNSHQLALNAWIKSEIEEPAFRDAYYMTWTVPYSDYSKIFRYARENEIPLIGINIDPSYINYIKAYGIGSVSQKY